jgi:hypothetical protein
MKRNWLTLARALAIALSAAAAALGCRGPQDGGGPGNAVLVIGFDSSLRSLAGRSLAEAEEGERPMAIVPAGISVSSVKVALSGPGGAKLEATSHAAAPLELELAPGTWTLAAKGCNSDGVELVEGSLEIRLGPSERVAKTIVLHPIAGSGSISLSWSLKGELVGTLAVRGSLEGPSGETRGIESPFARPEGSPLVMADLPNGGWKLSLSLLKDGVPVCGLADGVLVAANMATLVSVIFSPPAASAAMSFLVPDYGATSLGLEPAVRRAAAGRRVAFEAGTDGPLSWFAEGAVLAETGPRLLIEPSGGASSVRIDCVRTGSDGMSPPRSGSARVLERPRQALGALDWAESLLRSEQDAAAQALERGLSDCRDLAWSPSGRLLAAAGKGSNCVSLFEAAEAGALFPLAVAGGEEEPGLVAPSRLRFASDSLILAISESEGAAYSLTVEGPAERPRLRLAGALADASLAGAKDLALVPAAAGDRSSWAYVAAQDAVLLLALGPDGAPSSVRVAATAGTGDLASFSKPACVALDETGRLAAVGTTGDDAIYLFDRDPSTGALALRQRIDKSAFPTGTTLSDPCSLAFAPGSTSLIALSYYGKAILRLDRNTETGAFAPTAGLKSGSGGVRGFATPRALCLCPISSLVAVAGGGAEDGLASFDAPSAGGLSFIGAILPTEGDAVPQRPTALAIAPDGGQIAVAADGALSVFSISIGN